MRHCTKTVRAGPCFNSKMVRFQGKRLGKEDDRHLVSIPKWCDSKRLYFRAARSFLCVSIPKWCDSKPVAVVSAEEIPLCFNSKMVRFQGNTFVPTKDKDTVSIPKWCDSKCASAYSCVFRGNVSIPKWCDSKSMGCDQFQAANKVSIPKWCDSKSFKKTCRKSPDSVSIPKWCDSKLLHREGDYCAVPFQFQNGAIPSLYVIPSGETWIQFQFQNGAIPSCTGAGVKRARSVSIPKWCDSKEL